MSQSKIFETLQATNLGFFIMICAKKSPTKKTIIDLHLIAHCL